MKPEKPAISGPVFEKMMAEIDAKLTTSGMDIPTRPGMAVREVSITYKLEIPLASNPNRMPQNIGENAALGEAIHDWYRENYGDRLKENPCPMHAVVLVDGDIYKLNIPRIFGTVNFVLTKDWMQNPGLSRGPATCNIVQLISDMTPAKAARLSSGALAQIGILFEAALPAAYTLESTNHHLMHSARGDIETAVASLMAQKARAGASKWASLQAAEKVLKAAIDLAGRKYKRTHNLAELSTALVDIGLPFSANAEIAAIQCEPGIRYGEESCSRDDAISAHHASIQLVNMLREAGANFDIGIIGKGQPAP